jgi:hypothetical protein
MKKISLLFASCCLFGVENSRAAYSLAPNSAFQGDGWFAPGEGGYAFLSSSSNAERGLAFNAATGNLILASGNNLRLINGKTGADAGSLNISGITGGTRAIQKVSTDGVGGIYVTNLAIAGEAFKVYKYTSESATPTLVYTGPSAGAPRLGDSFDVGLVAGNLVGIVSGTGLTGFNIISLNGTNLSSSINSITASSPATVPAAGDFRLGISIYDNDTIIGTQGGKGHFVDVTGSSTGIVSGQYGSATSPAWNSSERGVEIGIIDGIPYLATVRAINGTGADNSTVNLYDASNPAAITLLDSKDIGSVNVANGNGSAAVTFGTVDGVPAVWALNTNNGISSFLLIPEPSSLLLGGLGLGLLIRRRR